MNDRQIALKSLNAINIDINRELKSKEVNIGKGDQFAIYVRNNKTRGLRRWPNHNKFNSGSSKGGSRQTQTD